MNKPSALTSATKSILTATMKSLPALAILTVLFLFMLYNPTRYMAAACFCITILVFLFLAIRAHRRMQQAVRRLTDEIAHLPNDVSEKPYDHIRDETRIFYEELTRVKRLLDQRSRHRQELLDIVNTVASNMEFGRLLHDLMPRLNESTRSSCSAFYLVNRATQKLEIKHSIGFSKNIYGEFDLTLGEGFIGQAAFSNNVTLYRDIPEDTVYYIRTFLGQIKPRNLIVAPISTQDTLTGVLVCASIYEYTREDREMIELIRYYMGVAVTNGEHFEQTRRLTNELTFQNKLIQDQHEVMIKRLDEKTQLTNYLINNYNANYNNNDHNKDDHYNNDVCLYALDDKNIVLAWNRHAERMHGVTGAHALGRDIDQLYREHNWPLLTTAILTAKRNGSYTACFWRTRPDGEKRRYELLITSMLNDAKTSFGVIVLIKEV